MRQPGALSSSSARTRQARARWGRYVLQGMSSAVPWWGSGLFTLCGAILGALATLSLGLLNRRTERRRLSRAEKVASYPELARAAGQLAELAVWPVDEDPRAMYREVDGLARRIAFIGPAQVNATLGPVVVAAGKLAEVVAWSGRRAGLDIGTRLISDSHRDTWQRSAS